MPKHTLIELFFIATGVAATVAIVATAAWAYPLARPEFEASGWVFGGIVVLLGIGPLRRAWKRDRGHG